MRVFDLLSTRLRRWHMRTVKPFGRPAPQRLRLSLGDSNADVARALAAAFADVPEVEVIAGNLLDLSCDAIVSPANSFGDMGGGIDKAIDDFYRGGAQRRLTAAIAAEYFGELPVGCALIVGMGTARFPFLVASPTMRVPGSVRGSINAYLSMRAALVAVLRHNAGGTPVRSVAVPGLCTGVGGMPYEEAATQMRVAFDSVIAGRWRDVVHPALAPFASGFTFSRPPTHR